MVGSLRNIINALIFIAGSFVGAQSQDPTAYFDAKDNDAYLAWLQDASDQYEKTVFLPSPAGPVNGVAIHWTIEGDEIDLAVAARATGWVGFGIAENGGMNGADVVTFTAETNNLQDGHILDSRAVIADDCQSWTLQNSQTDGGFLIFEATRLLDTGDLQDRPIINDASTEVEAHRIIAAWGDTPTVGRHGPNENVRSSLRFHADEGTTEAFAKAMDELAEGSLDIGAEDYPIKAIETEYARFCFSHDDLVNNLGMPNNTELHTIGFEPYVDPRAVKYVHHFILTGSEETFNDRECGSQDGIEIAYAWAPGGEPFMLPDNVGGPLGEKGFKSFELEIHYNNPWLDTGVFDSSGVRLHYTSKKREHDLGVMVVGDPFVQLNGQPVGDGLVQHSFECNGSCSGSALDEPITVIRELLHMHKSGKSMYNYQRRDGEDIRQGEVQHWNFAQQGAFSVQQPAFEIQPGDSFRTECFFDSTKGEKFGLSSQEEMCMAFFFYYPKKEIDLFGTKIPFVCGYNLGIDICDSAWEKVELDSTNDLKRTFGNGMETCSLETSSAAARHVVYSMLALALVAVLL